MSAERVVDRAERWVDGGLDIMLIAAAGFTMAYHLGLFTQVSVVPLMIIAVGLTGAGIAARTMLGTNASGVLPSPATPAQRGMLGVIVGLSAVSAVVTAASSGPVWIAGWGCAAVSVLLTAFVLVAARRTTPEPALSTETTGDRIPSTGSASMVVGLAALGAATLSLFALRVDPDDAFYVNRAQYVAENGTIPTRDVLFSPGTLPPLAGAGSTPVQAIETLQGAIAHIFGLSAGTVCYLIFPPILTFAAVWSVWRLSRTWAIRAPFLVWAVAMTYLAFGGQQGANFGVFFLARIWQGKVFFVAAVIPLLFHYATVWASRRSARSAFMLAISGIASTGLTSSATFLVPIIAFALVVGLLAAGQPWWGMLLAAAYPVATALVVMLLAPVGDPGGRYFSMDTAQHFVLGVGPYGAIGWFAVLVAPWLIRGRAGAVVGASSAMALVVALAPGFGALFAQTTGAGAVAWRLVWVAPVVTMVGLLATAPLVIADLLPSARAATWLRGTSALAAWAVLVAVVTAVAGHPFISKERSVSVEDQPTWKYPITALREARAIEELDPGQHPVLAPRSTMRALSLTSAHVYPVNPNDSYVRILEEPAEDKAARKLLTSLMSPGTRPSTQAVVAALDTLEVGMVCLPESNTAVKAAVAQQGWATAGSAQRLTCYRSPKVN